MLCCRFYVLSLCLLFEKAGRLFGRYDFYGLRNTRRRYMIYARSMWMSAVFGFGKIVVPELAGAAVKLDTMVAQLQLFPHFFFSLLILGLSQSCGFQPSSPLSFSPSTTKWPRYSTSQLPSCGSCGGKLTSSAPLMAWPEHDIATRRAPRRYISGLSRQVSWLPSTLSACCMPRIG